MQTTLKRLLAVNEALLAHQRWLAGLQASPFIPPELDGDKAAVVARHLNPKELSPGMEPEDYGAADPISPRRCSNLKNDILMPISMRFCREFAY